MANRDLDNIIKENTPRLRSYVKSRVRNNDDADDIVQDTFYQFFRTLSIMDNPIGQMTSWLFTVAHNLIINHGKKHKEVFLEKMKGVEDESFMTELSEILATSDSESPEMCMLRKMVWEELDKALSDLPEEQRQAVEMTEIQGLSVKEAASQMGVSQNTFLSRKHYAVVFVRKRLKVLYDELVNDA